MSGKKVGIITLHRNVNYGANLQAYASCRYLQKLGHQAQVVDYMSKPQNSRNRLFGWLRLSWKHGKSKSPMHNIKLLLALAISAGWKNKRLKNFAFFRKKYIELTPYCKNEQEIAALGLDNIVCGSDQIWNPDITNGLNRLFFGDVSGASIRVSYAASIGHDRLTPEDEEFLTDLIKRLDACSVREEHSADYVRKLSGREVQCVCDPVFLLNKEDYEELISKRLKKGKYILLYSVVGNEKMTEIAKEYAQSQGLPLIELCSAKTRKCGHRQIPEAGPLEFLNYFRYAETIITNSFHGAAFSILFEKDVYIIDNKAGGSRITNLLCKAGISDRLITECPSVNVMPINYAVVKANMKAYIEGSKEFLRSSLAIIKRSVIDKDCTGCGACVGACPKGAVSLTRNQEGFLIASINENQCIGCDMCSKVCPTLQRPSVSEFKTDVYAFKADDDIRKKSTSGGAFSALANEVIKVGGSVYCAGPLQNNSVKHIRCDSYQDIEKSCGVKYIQSDFSDVYALVEQDLKQGKRVLVSGTPCQVSAMRNFVTLKRLPTEQLYLVDIICHGIPSPTVFVNYISWLEQKYKSSVKKYYFRNKDISWRGNSCRAVLEDGRVIDTTPELNCFMNTYYSGNITNESCYNCPYTTNKRFSDLTISDYWGIEACLPDFEDALGVSMILVNSQKGKELFERCEGQKKQSTLIGAKQPQLEAPCKRPADRDIFWQDYFTMELETIFKKYGGYQKNSRMKQILYKIKNGVRK